MGRRAADLEARRLGGAKTATSTRRRKKNKLRRDGPMARQRCGAEVCSSTSLCCLSIARAGYATDLTVSRLKHVPMVHQAELQPPSWRWWWRRGRVREWELKAETK